MNKYLFDEKEYEAALLSDLFLKLEDILDDLREGESTDYKEAKSNAVLSIQTYLLKYYDDVEKCE